MAMPLGYEHAADWERHTCRLPDLRRALHLKTQATDDLPLAIDSFMSLDGGVRALLLSKDFAAVKRGLNPA